jgi:hypothetical protein
MFIEWVDSLSTSNKALPESHFFKREELQSYHLPLLGAKPGTPLYRSSLSVLKVTCT